MEEVVVGGIAVFLIGGWELLWWLDRRATRLARDAEMLRDAEMRKRSDAAERDHREFEAQAKARLVNEAVHCEDAERFL